MTIGKFLSFLVGVALLVWFLRPEVIYYSGRLFPAKNSVLGEWVGTLPIEQALPDNTPSDDSQPPKFVIGGARPPQLTHTSGVLYLKVTPFTSGQVTDGLYEGEGQFYVADTGMVRNVKNNFYLDSDKGTFTFDMDSDDVQPHMRFGRLEGSFAPNLLSIVPKSLTYAGEKGMSFQGSLHKGSIAEYSNLIAQLPSGRR